MQNNKGLEMTIATVVIIVLGLVLLVALIWILNTQTGFFSSMISGLQGRTNVDAIIQGCNNLVTGQQTFSYCCESKTVDLSNQSIKMTCDQLRQQDFVSGRIRSLDCSWQNCSG